MESGASELIETHHLTPIGGGGDDRHSFVSNSIISSVQSSYTFSSVSAVSSVGGKSTLVKDSPPDLPKLLSKDTYHHHFQSASVIVENGLFSSRSEPNLLSAAADQGSSEGSSALQPPLHSASGTPMCIKRGPGRPRKDGASASKCSNSLNKFKKFCSGNYVSGNVRGVRGSRKKLDCSSLPFPSSGGSLSDLGIIDGDLGSFTEDTMGSDSSSVASSFDKLLEDFTFSELWPGKVCGFCNLSEKSMSGQGDLLRLEIPVGFDPSAILKKLLEGAREISDPDKASMKELLASRKAKVAGKIKRLTSQGSLESTNDSIEEVVGYPEEIDMSLVFEQPAGHFFVHSGCARWCHNVITGDKSSSSFENLEVELVRALSHRCSHCGNFGAGLVCSVPDCVSLLHLPCAAASGAFQEATSLKTVCSLHLDMVVSLVGNSSLCTVCDEQTNLTSMIMCSTCGHHYHTACMALSSDPSIRPGWQCPACKMCQACRQPGDEGKLLACEACDKAYHTFCLRPALTSLPKHSWKCKMCRECSDCGSRTPGSGPSSRWHGNFSICDSCYQQRNKGLACPLCGKAYRHVAQKLMLQCHLCKKYVHGSCDANAELSTYQLRKELYPDYEYICPVCKAGGNCNAVVAGGGNLRALSSTSKKSSDKDVLSTSESNSLITSNFALSQDSLVFMEEDSAGATESGIDLIWSDKVRTASVVPSESPHTMPVTTPPSLQALALPPSSTPVPAVQPKKRNGAGRQKSTEKMVEKAAAKKKGKGRGAEYGRKRGPKPKMRGVFGVPGVGLQRPSSDVPKGEEEPGVENRLVLCSSKDEFVLEQDVCVMCGAYGNDLEGRLIACAQCGQCYHPYCVNVKVTKVVLEKGWRCLDCTVCEGCGQRHDEGRLILCDDCDVSYHIYCINPPLEVVPQGNWKCKWCAVCTLCGSNDPGVNSSWHQNYTLCGPCNSLHSCPVCSAEYAENELIIKCQNCDRWLHGSCDVILTEEEAEKCADFGYQCILCRPREIPPPHLLPPPPVLAKLPQKSPECSRSRSSSNHVVDGVWLSNSGMSHIRCLSLDQPRKKRKKLSNIADMEAGILEAIESVVSGAASRNHSEGEDSQSRAEDKDDSDKGKDGKKRRTLQKFGVGGFIARLRGPRFKDEDLDMEIQNGGPLEQPLEKPKRKPSRRKTKSKLIECFPAYLQEAFFGKGLLDCQSLKEEVSGATAGEDDLDVESVNQVSHESTINLSAEDMSLFEGSSSESRKENVKVSVNVKKETPPPLLVKTELKKTPKPISQKSKSSGALQELLPLPGDLLDNDLVDTIMNEDMTKVPDGIDDLGVTSGLVDDSELGIDRAVGEANQKDLTDFLSSIDSGLPSMDSKDVEDIFKGVLTDEPAAAPSSGPPLFPMGGSQPPPQVPPIPSPVPIPTGGILMPQNLNASVSAPTVQGSPSLSRSNSLHSVPQGLASPLNFPPPSPYHSEYSNSPAFSEPPSPWPAAVEGDVETPGNYSQRSILKWEVDEALGSNATISAVLYANMNHPELKRDHPNWAERSKQIAKIWRSLPTDKRAPYLQKARENRAASRMQKAQQDQEKLMPPVKATRGETQEERHWKQLQAYRQQQAQQQQLALQEQRLQGDPKDHLLSPGKHPFPSPGIPMVHRQGSNDMSQMSSQMDHARLPLQVSTNQHMSDGGPGGLVSPHLQSMNNPRQSFPGQLNTGQSQATRMRPPTLEMPPPSPSPHFSPKHGLNTQQQSPSPLLARSPMYSRIPYMHSPRPPLTSPSADPYGNSPLTPQSDPYNHPPLTPRPDSDSNFSPNAAEGYGQQGQKLMNDQYMSSGSPNEMDTTGPLTSPRTPGGVPPAQETRQHLRDLLQRQQIKKMEQDGSPMSCDLGPNGQRPMNPWPTDEWQKGSMESGKHANLSPCSPISQMPGTQFRQPFIPQHSRMPPNSAGATQMLQGRIPGPEFRQVGPHSPLPQGQQQVQIDQRMRVLLHHQQLQQSPSQQRGMNVHLPRNPGNPFPNLQQQQQLIHQQQGIGQTQASFQVRPNGSGYDTMQQQNQRLCQMGVIDSNAQVTSSMLAQQLGRPLAPGRGLQPPQSPLPISQCSNMLQMSSGGLSDRVGSDVISSEHQELPESVTAELEKLEEEQHRGDNGGGVEGDSVELADLGMDDDELLGMGADFNILEYADPELNIVVGGEKTNILDDNLDLEEEKEEEKEIKRKEEEKSEKKESNGAQFNSNLPPVPVVSGAGNQDTLTGFPAPQVPKPEFPPCPPELGANILGPPQPPPYPVPPPPYPGPGRPTSVGVGIRNGGGDLSLQPVQPAMHMSMIFKNSVMGGGSAPPRRPQQHHQVNLAPPIPSHAPPPPPSTLPPNQRRTLLLQEQPLLLEDLLEQEKREQQRQGPMLINPTAEEPLLSDFDFERLKADVLSSNNLPPSLSPPTLPGQGLLPPPAQQPMYNRHPIPAPALTNVNSLQQTSHIHQPTMNEWKSDPHRKTDIHHENVGMHVMPAPGGNHVNNAPMRLQVSLIPPPPVPPDHPTTDQERQMVLQYEQWIYHQQQVLNLHQKYFDGEVAKLRKIKKSLNSKQRQLRKNGSELNENDAMELERVVKELGGIQKQLDQARKQTRQHGTIIQDYQNKQQKRNQIMMMNKPMGPGPLPPTTIRQNMVNNQPMQPSPIGNPNHSPLHSTPQSPMLSPAPAMSPLTQHSPMPSPMAPSPGPTNSNVQTSPRGSLTGGMHHMDDRPFSPNNNDGMRSIQSPGGIMTQNRMQGPPQHRNMGNGQGQGMPQNAPQHVLQGRGMGMQQQQQQRHMTFVLSNVQQRMRPSTGSDQLRMQRFQRLPMGQEMMMRGRMCLQNPPFQSPISQQQSLGKPPGSQHYNSSQKVPFPVQSPTGGMNMRSPSPLMQIGSPPGNQMLNQNRVSPASSPMRRPSGSGSVGLGSPCQDRPKSVENPLTPRSAGSGPHTPSSVGGPMSVMSMDMSGGNHHSGEGLHEVLHHQQQSYAMHNPNPFNPHGEMGSSSQMIQNQQMGSSHGTQNDIGSGGGGSSRMIPYPTFSWYSDPDRLGLKGGSPFSVVNGETHAATSHTEQGQSNNDINTERIPPTENSNSAPVSNGSLSPVLTTSGSAMGESQNALLKQLLQNTGCASTSQSTTEPTRFSLSNCLPTRPTSNASPVHTSQLSEAATRIPQPQAISRQAESPQAPPSQISPSILKVEPMEQTEAPQFGVMRNVVRVDESLVKEEVLSAACNTPRPPKDLMRKESFSSTLAETIDVVASDQTALDPAIYEARRAEDEARKARRRQYQSNRRRQSTGKEPQPPKKRARKGSKMEEDYELYLETLMTQLRQLPPIGITEPDLGRNYGVCAPPGIGDMSKLHTRRYSRIHGDLVGDIGNSRIRGEADYYYTFPFGTELAEREKKPPSTQRGFYSQEFASPRMGSYCDREASNSRSSSPGRDCDTPDTIVSSSSPEPACYDRTNPYSELKYINEEEDLETRSASPGYEIQRPIPIRPVPPRFDLGTIKEEMDKENKNIAVDVNFSKTRCCGPLRESRNVTVTLTLASNAVDDISGVLRNLANILSISSPSGFQVTDRTLTPPSTTQKVGSYTYRSKDGKEAVDIQSILNGTAKFCRHCDVVVLSNIIRKKPSDLPGLRLPNVKEENGDGTEDFYFCSSTCFVQFSLSHGIAQSVEEKASAVVRHPSESETSDTSPSKDSKPKHRHQHSKATSESLEKSKERGGKRIKLEDGKQWKGTRYRNWTVNQTQQTSPIKYKKPSDKELTELLFRMGITVSPPKIPEDTRQCLFCHQLGDSVSDGPARLLNLDVDKWVHLNCALWSEEVYETENGALVNVEVALKQSLALECIACSQKGATVKCFKVRCSAAYHLGCAVKENCVFYKNKTVYCSSHIPKGEKDNELTTLAVFRRVYIQRDENRQVAAVMHHADQHHLLRVGSLIFLSVGQLLPHQLSTFHTRNYIFPIGYKIVRFYWSMFRINKRCQYICSIHEADGKPEFRITVEENGTERVIKSETAQGAWHQVLEAIMKLRATSNSIKVFPTFITGEDLFGLTEPAIVKVLESLPGVETLSDYHFKYGRNPLLELPLAINPTGCARSEPKLRTHFKRPHTQRTGSSRSTSAPITSSYSSDPASCPYSKQFVHSKSSQYRKMKQDWRNNVYLARSKIQGLGLYAARDIEKHTMVIEYIGEIIRSELAELREKRYESQNRGIYMFRVDENRVIDATLCGGLARYINHSCNPNCVAEQVEVERDIRIIIFTSRRICRGEELSYDYKFEFEDDQHKIPCLCGAPNCRQWMN